MLSKLIIEAVAVEVELDRPSRLHLSRKIEVSTELKLLEASASSCLVRTILLATVIIKLCCDQQVYQ